MNSKPECTSINLVSLESITVPLNIKAAKTSNFISSFNDDYPNEDLVLRNINYSIIIKIKDFLEYHVDHPPKKILMPNPKKDFKDCVDQWDYDFINNCDVETILQLMNAANFLQINSLLDLTSAKIASMIKGKNSEEIRRILNMEDDDENEIECAEEEKVDSDDDNDEIFRE